MPNSIDPNAVLARALDGLALRQQVTSNNVANVDTPGFKASEVRFEDALRSAISQQNSSAQLVMAHTNDQHLTAAAGDDVLAAQIVQLGGTVLRNDGNNVDIEQQMSTLAETSLMFSSLSEALRRRFAIERMIASDGRV